MNSGGVRKCVRCVLHNSVRPPSVQCDPSGPLGSCNWDSHERWQFMCVTPLPCHARGCNTTLRYSHSQLQQHCLYSAAVAVQQWHATLYADKHVAAHAAAQHAHPSLDTNLDTAHPPPFTHCIQLTHTLHRAIPLVVHTCRAQFCNAA